MTLPNYSMLVRRYSAFLMSNRSIFYDQSIVAKKKKALRREWTKDDVRQMKQMARAKAGVTRIAKALKRTPGATTVKAAKLGVSLSMR